MPVYFIMMGAAAAFGFAKLLVLALVMPAAQFGSYAGAAGAATVVSALLSFGLLEGTIKRFPRYWADGETGMLVGASKWMSLHVTKLTLAGSLLAVPAGYLIAGMDGVVFTVLAVPLALITLIGRVVSALNLSIGDAGLIWRYSFIRSISAFVLVPLGGYFFGWIGALVGEIAAMALIMVQGTWSLRHRLPFGAEPVKAPADYNLYTSALLVNIIGSGDRAVVAALAGPAIAGAYAFALMFAQIGQVVVNILAQKTGPQIIKVQRAGASLRPTLRLLSLPATAIVGTSLALLAVAFVGVNFEVGNALLAKYDIDLLDVGIACFISITFLCVVLEYAVVAIDRERVVTLAAWSAAVVLVIGAGTAWTQGAAATGYLLAMAIAKSIQLAILSGSLVPRRFLQRGNGAAPRP